MHAHYLIPDWPAPPHIQACTTLRTDGHSQGKYSSFNMGGHVLDDAQHVAQNHQQLRDELTLQQDPYWLRQVHSASVVCADQTSPSPTADAAYTSTSGLACAVLTADCLPLLICDRQGSQVAAIHAGWRGLAAGIIPITLDALRIPVAECLVWLGPAIGPQAYEVGDEVREVFIQRDPPSQVAFVASSRGRWLANLYLLAKQQLAHYGINEVFGGQYCTYSDATRFYSYRRDGKLTGRMASLIWILDKHKK